MKIRLDTEKNNCKTLAALELQFNLLTTKPSAQVFPVFMDGLGIGHAFFSQGHLDRSAVICLFNELIQLNSL